MRLAGSRTPEMLSKRFSRSARKIAGLVVVMVLSWLAAVAAPGADLVILKDGFVLQGNFRKESITLPDSFSGKLIATPKSIGYETVDEGPKFVNYSTHFRQQGEISKEAKIRPEMKAYIRLPPGQKSNDPLPPTFSIQNVTEYDANWLRKIKVNVPGSWEVIEERITSIDPYFLFMYSTTHYWRSAYRTVEFDPARVRKLLSTHPDLIEKDGKPNASKRIAIAKFMLDAGWLKIAKDDLESFQTLFPDGIPKEAKDAYEKLSKEIDHATADLVVKELELALAAGRYNYAAELREAFPRKLADAKQTDDATKLMAQLATTEERYRTGRRLLRAVLDEVTGSDRTRAAMAATGGWLSVRRGKQLPTQLGELAAAAEQVYDELHPDTALRLESFVNLAAQAEKEKLQGRDPTKKADELLATVVSGWALGKNGANPDPVQALKSWNARETVLSFQRTEDMNARNTILHRYKKDNPVSIDELAQIISLLPPASPENLNARTGTPSTNRSLPSGIYKRTTASTPEHPAGTSYFIKLPPEYHHGRAYPVLIALGSPNFDTETLIASLSRDADRNGYIIVAPDWANQFGKGWQWKGEDHWYVTGVLRDVVRSFCVDNDRVFMTGVGDGANMALDIGLSHPDLFAGVLPMCPLPKPKIFQDYWGNAQTVPYYVVTGELAGDSNNQLRTQLFDRWMPRGYGCILNVYKGRGVEWYSAEVPVMFDWMSRKKRVNVTSVLKLDDRARQQWSTMRTTDNRFYWLQVNEIDRKNLLENHKNGEVIPARINGDVQGNNTIRVKSTGIKKFSILLTSDLIDWGRGVKVVVNDSLVPAYNKAKVLEPSVETLLNDYRDRGDRRVLVLGKLDFNAIP
jgi:hypothetical protein